jgi:cytochrome c-type biogenesis protein
VESAQTVTYPVAFLAGWASFITPCVLPLVPVYLSILSGASFNQLTGKEELSAEQQREIHARVLSNAVAFIIGFSIIFIILGLVSQTVGQFLTRWGFRLVQIIGAVLILLGMNMSGVWKPRLLNMEARFQLHKGKWGLLSSAAIGSAFAFGWTPCVGPILAPILVIAGSTGSKLQGALLLATYSLGLGVPFFLSALSVNGLIAFSNKMKRYFDVLEITLGAILMYVGVFLLIGGTRGLDMLRSILENASSG